MAHEDFTVSATDGSNCDGYTLILKKDGVSVDDATYSYKNDNYFDMCQLEPGVVFKVQILIPSTGEEFDLNEVTRVETCKNTWSSVTVIPSTPDPILNYNFGEPVQIAIVPYFTTDFGLCTPESVYYDIEF